DLEVKRLIVAAREPVPRQLRRMLQPELKAAVSAMFNVLNEIASELPTQISVGVDLPPPPSRLRARSAMDALTARIIQLRPTYIGHSSSAEIENLASFTDSLAILPGQFERLLDEPPQPLAISSKTGGSRLPVASD